MAEAGATDRSGEAVPYRRVLIKISGEALMGPQSFGIDLATVDRIAQDLKEAWEAGVHSMEIDDAGEKGVGPAVFDHAMQKLRARGYM